MSIGKLFIRSMEFDNNISDLTYDCTDYKNVFDFFMRFVKWQKISSCQKVPKSDFKSQVVLLVKLTMSLNHLSKERSMGKDPILSSPFL